jgi:hypothetical protein
MVCHRLAWLASLRSRSWIVRSYAAVFRRLLVDRSRVRAAFRAAALRASGPLVRTARRAAALRAVAVRRLAADVAWRDRALCDAARRPSRLSAVRTARERREEGWLRLREARRADSALRLVAAFARAGGGSFTPARRAFDSPIAIACFAERAPCLPSRT